MTIEKIHIQDLITHSPQKGSISDSSEGGDNFNSLINDNEKNS